MNSLNAEPLPHVAIDADLQLLVIDGRNVALQPRVFALLQCLSSKSGQVVGKEQLLDEVWGHRFITEGVIKTAIGELRAALGDDVKQPRWIETVPRRGYRYIGVRPLEEGPPVAPVPPTTASRRAALVGREDALATLESLWVSAGEGRPGVVLVSGDAGIGKTALLSDFMHRCKEGSLVAVGQSAEALGEGEPYLAFLEALSALVTQQPELLGQVRRVAPTWLRQMPWHVPLEDREALTREVAGASQERMLREFAVLLDQIAVKQPCLLVLEDLHWSDSASVELLGHLARRHSTGRWMLAGSFRPVDVAVTDHPLGDMRRELRLHGLISEIALGGFTEGQLARLIEGRFPGAQPPAEFLAQLLRHTDGLPLFVDRVLAELVEQGWVRQADSGAWTFPAAGHALPLPCTLLDLMERQIDRLPAATRQMLEIAALVPNEVDDAVLAEVLGIKAADVRQRLDGLVRRRIWLLAREPHLVSGERVGTNYGFQHALMRHAFEQRLSAGNRAALHRQLRRAMETVYGPRSAERSVELAEHARLGHEPFDAARHYCAAAQQAMQRIAPYPALDLVRAGLAQLEQFQASADVDDLRLELLLMHVRALVATRGWNAPHVEEAFGLVAARPVAPKTLPVWHAAIRARHNMGRWSDRDELLARLERFQEQPDSHWMVSAVCANARGFVNTHRNQPLDAIPHLERALQLFEQNPRPAENPEVSQDFEISTLCHLYIAHVELGDSDRAAAAAARLEGKLHAGVTPLSESMALIYLSMGAQLQEDDASLARFTQRAQALLGSRDLPGAGPHGVMLGWSLCQGGDRPAGIARLQSALRLYESQGFMPGRMYYQQMLARQALYEGRLELAENCLQSCEALYGQGETSLRGEVLITRAAWLAYTSKGNDAVLACLAEAEAYARARSLGRLLQRVQRERDRLM